MSGPDRIRETPRAEEPIKGTVTIKGHEIATFEFDWPYKETTVDGFKTLHRTSIRPYLAEALEGIAQGLRDDA